MINRSKIKMDDIIRKIKSLEVTTHFNLLEFEKNISIQYTEEKLSDLKKLLEYLENASIRKPKEEYLEINNNNKIMKYKNVLLDIGYYKDGNDLKFNNGDLDCMVKAKDIKRDIEQLLPFIINLNELIKAKNEEKKCKSCKTENYIDSFFCKKCGKKLGIEIAESKETKIKKDNDVDDDKLEKICDKCKHVNEANANFCENCSNDLSKDNKKKLLKDSTKILIKCSICKADNEETSNSCTQCGEKLGKSNLEKQDPNMKICPDCTTKCEININFCPSCNHKFSKRIPKTNPNTDVKKVNNTNNYNDFIPKLKLTMKKCPFCSKENEANVNFCTGCNFDYKQTVSNKNYECFKCESKYKKGDKFCGSCGNDLLFKILQPKENIDYKECPKCSLKCSLNRNFCESCFFKFPKKVTSLENVYDEIDTNTKICPDCTTKCEININFCPSCNHKFLKAASNNNVKICSKCDNKIKKSAKFCNECGNNINNDFHFNPKIDPTIKICPDCTTKCEININFCPTCNYKFIKPISHKNNECLLCKSQNNEGDKICSTCGNDLIFVKIYKDYKECPLCTTHCSLELNFCPVCNFKFPKKVKPKDDGIMKNNDLILDDTQNLIEDIINNNIIEETINIKNIPDAKIKELEIKYNAKISKIDNSINIVGSFSAINKIKSKLFDLITNNDQIKYPQSWDQMDEKENLKLVTINNDSEEYKKIYDSISLSVPNPQIIKIERIQNKWLWKLYSIQTGKLIDKGVDINEKWLFHGTRNTDPVKIYDDETGFDMRFMNVNGIYFAGNASYSKNGYLHKNPIDGTLSMFYARVALGACTEDQQACASKIPPIRQGNMRYDSAKRVDNVYIIFESSRAYPEYLITFRN